MSSKLLLCMFQGPPGALPVSKDPFGNDPFSMNAQPRPPVSSAAGGFPTTNPFGGAGFGAPPQQQMFGAPPPRGMMPGVPGVPGVSGVPGAAGVPGFMGQPAFGQPAGVGRPPNPFGMGFGQMPTQPPPGNLFGETSKEDSNLLQPMRKDDGSAQKDEAMDKAPKKMRDDLFGDLLDIKKTAGTSGDSPKDLFAKASMAEKKSMNAMKAQASTTSPFDSEPFGPSDLPDGDKTRGLLSSHSEDPFNTSHIPATLSEPPVSAPLLQSSSIPEDTPPPVPKRPVPSKEKSKTVLSPPHPLTLSSSKPLQSAFSSSSSSLSSSSSSTSPSLSSKVHHEPPLGKPPPLPKRTPADGASPSKTCDMSHINKPPSDLALSNLLPATGSDLLPSPDEPPPPLPNISYATAAPPPPPRPSSSFPASQSSPRVAPKGEVNSSSSSTSLSSQPTEIDFKVKFDETSDDVFSSATGSVGVSKTDQKPKLQLKTDTPRKSSSATVQQTHSPSSSPKVVPRDPADPFSPSLSFLKTKAKSRAVPNPFSQVTDKQCADPFLPPPPSGHKIKSAVPRTAELQTSSTPTRDPFMMPLHLTPGFKVEAKFGSDPFDDSFHEVLHGKPTEVKWDPFSPDPTSAGSLDNSSNNGSAVSCPKNIGGTPA